VTSTTEARSPAQGIPRKKVAVDAWSRVVYRDPYHDRPRSGRGKRARSPWHLVNVVTLEALCGTRLIGVWRREVRDEPYWLKGDEPRICGRCGVLSRKMNLGGMVR
jgi:hypothetical protein